MQARRRKTRAVFSPNTQFSFLSYLLFLEPHVYGIEPSSTRPFVTCTTATSKFKRDSPILKFRCFGQKIPSSRPLFSLPKLRSSSYLVPDAPN
ncbi:hypothetical protein BRADI_1g24483v3 [Brachypodium distachyon]|uniref:Uncharacterized protein n=1 Tax=Brachypodium distachyon TaxID=15368 RepID=A0A2K2DKX8_BRADI|nr:hypothetical protein BRADI_1g24483v3 [Brachypodium distachyon]